MSTLDSAPEVEPAEEPLDLTLRRMVCAIDYAEGFWLGFAKSNTPAQRRRLSTLCKDLLEPLKIRVLEIELNEPITDLLPVLRERLAQEGTANNEDAATPGHKLAIFVHGLERSIPSREAYPPLLSALNLKRELFRQEVPHPLLLWLPDYALTALARQAPDFWAWRSGLYEFVPERETTEQFLETVRNQDWYTTISLSEQAKRERLVMLKGLLDDYHELGDGPRELEARANILNEIGQAHMLLGELDEAKQAYEESLTLFRNLKVGKGEVDVVTDLGRVAQLQGAVEEARALFEKGLEISRRLGYQNGTAGALYYLGILVNRQGNLEEGYRLLNESLEIVRETGHEGGIAVILNQLANLARRQGEVEKARRLYGESMELETRLGYQSGVADNLHQLGILTERQGNKAEAMQMFREALNIHERLGSPHAETVRRSLARLEDSEDTSN